MPAALIALDWGTSSFRAWLMDGAGRVLDELSAPMGILAVPEGDFDGAFESWLAGWLAGAPDLPIIASGMITSRNGWVETPYAALPVDVETLAAQVTPHRTRQGRLVHFVTGVAQNPADGLPDVIRGEETEIIGHLAASGAREGLFLLPGTHSKWLRVRDGAITDFSTAMTGELFALLSAHSILGRLMEPGPPQPVAFDQGVEVGRRGDLPLRLFSARALPLFGRLPAGAVSDYLSGLLIGAEMAAALNGRDLSGGLTIVGRGDLAERYARALTAFAMPTTIAAPGMARHGLMEIAKRAGLLA